MFLCMRRVATSHETRSTDTRKPEVGEMAADVSPQRLRYDAFISYSHAVDGRLAPAIRSGLHRFAQPVFSLRALNVFRDQSSLSASPGLWPSIEDALSQSRHFIVLASPEAARSPWVRREVGSNCSAALGSPLSI